MPAEDIVKQKNGRDAKRGASKLDIIVLTASMVIILAACATAKPAKGEPPVSGSPIVSASPAVPSVSAGADTQAASPSAAPAAYPEYTPNNTRGG